ncbi:MAG: Outer membrane and periplasm component of type IV secretion of T-DNA complex, has secretin-like domain, VirB9 [uncultured Paraburkholderia sp.]|uniref:TrbG/VirB9 family P-type conjugative transfer protein n=1 Tax=uncultured Paraburkholderia sp. TaxID=1822466 RepID=UPI00259352C8|nr:TrbG/VirB9 family P-type conjugative transfer protein [uncultured Paraburkholderia sp.]CAH2902104.1 MAG: Outer membrane and periplasm component of type IV secretion of T-DNA complex, has secretin-like domain, VirB9 [uncultured Paraburkholderia sp.]CAH2936524.1 MAG: Outer membrane and periplasm component of type IV secretion of T-DNA complex, has secretin-like domain, VirB9 [uncultured Paraburkholderia sp.]
MKLVVSTAFGAALFTACVCTAWARVAASEAAPVAPLPTSAVTVIAPQPMVNTQRAPATRARASHSSTSRARINGPYPAPDDSSLVVYDYDADYRYPVLVRTNEETHLVFGSDEEVVGVYLSDTGKRWLEHTALTKRDVFIEARLPALDNAVTVITTRRRYELDLRSSDHDAAYQRVSWHYLDTDAQMTAGQVSPFGIEYPGNVPGANIAAQAEGGTPTDSSASGDARAAGPRISLDHANFDYRVEGSAPFAPVTVFDDGRFTYLQFPHHAELPAILVMDEKGQAEIASFIPLGDDFFEVQQSTTYGLLLRRGKEEVRIFNGRGHGCGLFGCDSARMKNIYGKS